MNQATEKQMKVLFIRMAGFAAFPLLSAITPLLVMPLVSRIAGPNGWSSIGTGLAIGIFAAAVILFGWNIVGPVRIAQSRDDAYRKQVYVDSIATRLALSSVVMPASGVLIYCITNGPEQVNAVLLGLATASTGLSPAWYCIGAGSPRQLAMVDTLPRVLGSIVSLPLLIIYHQVWVYALFVFVATLISLLLFHVFNMRGGDRYEWSIPRLATELRRQAAAAGVNLAGNAYGATPVPIADGLSPGPSASRFVSIDQLYRYALFSVVVLANAFQGWTLEQTGATGRKRQIVAIAAHATLGAIGGTTLALVGPWLSSQLFGLAVAATRGSCVYYGIAFLFLSIAAPLQRNILVPNNQSGTVLASTICGAVVGLAMMVAYASHGIVDGVALGMAVSEALVFALLVVPAFRVLAHNRNRYPSEPEMHI